jgi:hypothetical protein
MCMFLWAIISFSQGIEDFMDTAFPNKRIVRGSLLSHLTSHISIFVFVYILQIKFIFLIYQDHDRNLMLLNTILMPHDALLVQENCVSSLIFVSVWRPCET